MKQIGKHDVNKLTAQDLKDKLPFELVSDGEVIAVVLPYHDINRLDDVNKAKAGTIHNIRQGTEARKRGSMLPQRKHRQLDYQSNDLRFSKSAQAAGRMR